MGGNPPPDIGAGQVTPGAQTPAPASPIAPFGAPTLSTTPQTYLAMQAGYFGPLQNSIQPAPPQLSDPTMNALAERIDALQQSHQVLSGQKPPDPNSVFARTSSKLSAGDIASQVGQQTWQQSVVQPFQDFVNTWKKDWKAGLMETLGGAAIIGGMIGLESITAGAATPFIFAAAAALVAPSMMQAWGNELQNPTDSNLVKALVSTSTGILAVGVPVKWAQGMSVARNSLSFFLRAKKELTSAESLAAKVLSGRPELRDAINFNRPIEEQLDVLATRPNEIRAQAQQYNAGMLKDKTVQDLINRSEALEGLRKAWKAAKNDPQKRAELEAEMKHYSTTEVLPLRLQVASHFLFLVDNRTKHIPLGPTEKTAALPAELQTAAKTQSGVIMGFIRQLGRGHGLDKEQDTTAKSLVEHQGRDMAAQGTGRAIASMINAHDELVKKLGLTDEQITEVEIGMEDAKAWDKLSGVQQLYGQYRATMHGAMTMAELRWGTIENAIAGYVPRLFTGTVDTDHTRGVSDIFASLRGAMISRSRIYKAAVDARGDINYYEKPRAELMRQQELEAARYKALRPLRDFVNENEDAVRKERKLISQLRRVKTRHENAGKTALAAEKEAEIQRHWDAGMISADGYRQKLTQLAHMESNQFEAVQRLTPSARKLVTGSDLFRASAAGYAYRMEEASLRAAAESHANLAVSHLKDQFGKKVSLAKYGLEIQQPEFKASGNELPDFMPETAFARGVGASRGYKPVFRTIGRPGELHYRPAVFARDDIADELHKIMDAATTGSEVFQGMSGVLYKSVYASKRLIMATPNWHAMNIGGRLVAAVLDDPVGMTTALSTVWGKGEHLLDPEARAALEMKWSQAGLLHANRFEVTNLLHRNMRNNDAQPAWMHVLRTIAGPLPHFYQDMLEGGFWKMVDDMQLAGAQLAEHKLTLRMPNAAPSEIQRLAAEYANNLVGMVNPLYMNKSYRHARNLVFFAPSYWATFTRMLLSLVPGSDRLSSFLAKYHGGQFVRFGAVPLKEVSNLGRRELTRMQRSWVTTFLTTGVVAADMMNVMLGGRHLWDNDQGHMFDINVDNAASWLKQHGDPLSPGGPATTPSGEVQHSYITAIPFFRQAADVMDALGLGHDWGLGHEFSDQTWQQADVLKKGLMAMGALADGVRRQASTKLGGLPQALYGGLTGEELSSRLGTGTQRQIQGPIGSWDGLLSLVPGGLTAERFMSDEQKAIARAGGAAQGIGQQLQQFAPQIGGSLVQQFTGLPTMYHMGPEQPPIDDSKMLSWYQERNNLHDALQSASKQMFMGDLSPLGYQRKRQQLLDRLVELDKVTFGNDTPAAALAGARANIASQLGLDNLGLSDSEWYARYQTFSNIWDATLQSASPQARATWWEHEHSQWTDADYLVWEAQEMKKSIAAAVDGQGGQYIAAFENQIASIEALPLTTAERAQIEQSDPYYYTYREVLKAMSRSSALGAFINAFTSPNSETYILEQGLTPAEQQQAALLSSGTASLITPQTATELAAQAKQLAGSPEVAQAGGQASASPQFEQTLQQTVSSAEGA